MHVGGVKVLDNQLLVGLLGDAITDADITAALGAARRDRLQGSRSREDVQ